MVWMNLQHNSLCINDRHCNCWACSHQAALHDMNQWVNRYKNIGIFYFLLWKEVNSTTKYSCSLCYCKCSLQWQAVIPSVKRTSWLSTIVSWLNLYQDIRENSQGQWEALTNTNTMDGPTTLKQGVQSESVSALVYVVKLTIFWQILDNLYSSFKLSF